MRIALAGNPNSGKTTLFNAITGKIEKVGNWAGVTVEKKEGKIKSSLHSEADAIIAVDLPGSYSMSPFTSEENVTRDFVNHENPEVIINIVDATNLSRSLFFTTQLLELGIPVVVALNKSDLNTKKDITVDAQKLSAVLGCPVIPTTATASSSNGLKELMAAVLSAKGKTQVAPFRQTDVDLTNAEAVATADKARYAYISTIITKVETRKASSAEQSIQDKVDRILANKFFGLPIFMFVMWCVFDISQATLGPMIADELAGYIDMFSEFVAGHLGDDVSPIMSALLLDGIIGGFSAVVGFLPLIMVMFFLLALLEDCGYMARVAVVMDRYFKRVGLSGKSIIPMVIGTGCAIPGVMATRTIKNERQRRTTAMLAPFMPCGAKLPVIALFSGVFFSDAAWVGTTMYFCGIFLIIFGAWLIVRITGEKNARSFFIMELPEYQVPSLWRATVSMCSRGKEFVIKAGTVILVCNATIHIMQTFNWSFDVVAEGAEATSILASIANPFAVLLIPLGFGVWQLAAAAITGFIAKENVVGTLAVVYGITNFIDTEELALTSGASSVAETMALTQVAALSYLMFNLFTPPCFAAIGAMNAEMENRKWLWSGIALQFGTGYAVAFLVYQIGTVITTGAVGAGFVPGLVVVAVMLGIVAYLVNKGNAIAAAKLKKA
ncbi:MAG: ferrous iron transporter B [Pseudomonadota bacterium]